MMQPLPTTVIIRHRRENLKKCSLRGLEGREDLIFLTYPEPQLPVLTGYVQLAMEGPTLSMEDAHYGLVLLDGTWRYADKMEAYMEKVAPLPKRSLPKNILTAYPRKQEDCPDPIRGLASVEALYIAYLLTNRDTTGLLDHYYWKEPFLKQFVNV